jgi:hypothetical protein
VIRFLADENFNGIITRGLLRRQPLIDLVTAREVGLGGADDPALLRWAADQARVTLTHDVRTLAGFAYDYVLQGLSMSGVIEVAASLPTALVIDDLLLIAEASSQEEWAGQVIYLPL